MIANPDRRSRGVCVMLLKPYFEQGSTSDCLDSFLAVPVSDPSLSTDGVVLMSALVEGNGEVLGDHLRHLYVSERAYILEVVHQFPELFGDVPWQTQVIEHDIDAGNSVPIKQHPYRINLVKQSVLKKEVEDVLLNNIAETSTSAWSLPCILFFFFLAFFGFIDRTTEECDRKQGKRGGVTRSKGTRARSRTRVRYRASAHGSHAPPTEPSGAPCHIFLLGSPTVCYVPALTTGMLIQ